jgi:hypothetical protein
MPSIKYPADGNLYVGWLADTAGTAITDVSAPETSELASIVDLSCDIQSGGVDLGISTATIDAASICSAFVAMANGRTTVKPTLTFWRYQQPDDTAWELFEKGSLGWLLVRAGIPTADALADGDMVTLAYVEMSDPMPEFPGGDTLTTFNGSMLLVNGQLFDQKAVIGGAS